MGRELCEAFPAARRVMEEVDEALGEPLSRLVFEGPIETLNLTENAQPALMAVSLAVVRAVEGELGGPLGAHARLAAGHSLGEYSALAAMGALQIGQAARLLRLRGRAMQAAVPQGEGGMTAVLGLSWEQAERLAAAAAEAAAEAVLGAAGEGARAAEAGVAGAGPRVCVPANDNAEGQVVLSGHSDALAEVGRLAKEHGARRAVPLPVSAPFHSPLMQPAAEAMAAALAEESLGVLAAPVVANATAEAVAEAEAFRRLLVEQVTARVRWRETMRHLAASGVACMAELGPGAVLCGLARKTARDLPALAVGDRQGIDSLLRQLGQAPRP